MLLLGLALSCTPEAKKPRGDADLAPTDPEVLRMTAGGTTIYRQNSLFTFRRNNWSLYCFFRARTDASAKRPSNAETDTEPSETGTTIVHFDAHSDMHPAPACSEPIGIQRGDLGVIASYTERLSVASFLLPSLYYGLADEIYWVQPTISCYDGEPESWSFQLEIQEGWIRPRIREGATAVAAGQLGMRSHHGLPVSRCLDLITATGHAMEDWEPGPFRLHCMSAAQFADRLQSGALESRRVLIDLDLDYFGTSGDMRGYGYLGFARSSQVAVGLLGGTLPVFYMSPQALQREAREVALLIERLAPQTICLCHSPDHTHREIIPGLEGFFRSMLAGHPPAHDVELDAAGARGVRPTVHIETGADRYELDPRCPSRVDLGGEDTFLADIEWNRSECDSIEVSIFSNPSGSEDRLVSRWVLDSAREDDRLAIPLTGAEGMLNTSGALGHGWELEIRRAHDGQLLFSAAFALDDGDKLLRTVLDELVGSGQPLAADPARYAALRPSQIIAEGQQLGLPPSLTHRIVLAHPQALAWQCENLGRFRAGPGMLR
jgi:hypothetical protein